MRFCTLFFSFAFLAVLSPVTVVKAEDVPVDSEPYCGHHIKDKLARMNPTLDGIKKIIIVIDFFAFQDDEKYFDKPFQMKVFGEDLKKAIKEKLKPIPKSEYDPDTLSCYWRDNRPVEVLYLGNGSIPLDTDKYEQAVQQSGNLILYVKRYPYRWAQKKKKNASRYGGLENAADTFAITAVLFRPDVHLDPRQSVLIPFSAYIPDNKNSPDSNLMSGTVIPMIAGTIFDSIR